MKRKIFIIFMIIFTVFLSGCMVIGFVCGAPMDNKEELGRYLFGSVGISILLPSGFTFFFVNSLDLSKKLNESENKKSEESKESVVISDNTVEVQIPAFVNALAKERNLTPEEKERLLSYLEDI